jgi:hypothetical protein
LSDRLGAEGRLPHASAVANERFSAGHRAQRGTTAGARRPAVSCIVCMLSTASLG